MDEMVAAGVEEFGPPEALKLLTLPRPEPGPGQLRVRVRAAGVQPADTAVRSGWGPPGTTLTLPVVPGNEFAGEADAVGPGVTTSIGTPVAGFRTLACYAEYVVVDAGDVVEVPDGVGWPVAGALSASGQTAHTACEALGVTAGQTVLVHGAAGGVGTVFVQLAVRAGARVLGVAAPGHHDHLRALGVEPLVYGDGLADRVRALAPGGVDAVLDAAGHGALRASLGLGAGADRIGTLVEFELAEELGCRRLRTDRSGARLQQLMDLVAARELAVHVRRVVPLADAADAHREIETGHGRGKVVLDVGL